MTFTLEDAENDGQLKKELGPELASIARQTSPRIYSKFAEVCEKSGQEPGMVLADHAIRAIKSEDFATQLVDTEVDIGKLRADDIRREDVKLLKDFAEEFDLTPDEGKHPIEQIIEQRLQAVGGGPFSTSQGDKGAAKDAKVKKLEQEVRALRQQLNGQGGGGQPAAEHSAEATTTVETDSNKPVDELFAEPEDEPEEEEETTDVSEEFDSEDDFPPIEGTEEVEPAEDEELEVVYENDDTETDTGTGDDSDNPDTDRLDGDEDSGGEEEGGEPAFTPIEDDEDE